MSLRVHCTLDVVVDTQHKHLCLWMYNSCLCINNFNLIAEQNLLCIQHYFCVNNIKCCVCLQLPMISENFLSYWKVLKVFSTR